MVSPFLSVFISLSVTFKATKLSFIVLWTGKGCEVPKRFFPRKYVPVLPSRYVSLLVNSFGPPHPTS